MPVLADSPVRRVFVEKTAGFAIEAQRLRREIAGFLGTQYPELAALKGLRIFHRYDAAHLGEAEFRRAVALVFSEPQCDRVFFDEPPPPEGDERYFGVEYLPGQYDQRADSAEQCMELAVGVKPLVRTARIYALRGGEGPLSDEAMNAVKRYLINPVDSREASPEKPASLDAAVEPVAGTPVLAGFRDLGPRELGDLAAARGFAMSREDMLFCQAYFASEGRDPSLAELRILDTYWSDHCRHSTFTTALGEITVESAGDQSAAQALRGALELYEEARREVYGDDGEAEPLRKRSLMDMATIGAKVLKKRGLLPDLEESGEINACTVRVEAEFSDGSREPWLLLFKNETHNHPTEIEPFGGAATCLGGAIRDPLSGRAFVYQAMRVSGGADPRRSPAETLPGKLPQIKIARDAAAGYASYGNQIGLTTGQVAEFYHPGLLAKRLELGAVIGAVPAAWVRREAPSPGDLVILVGGATGRDGIGGATGSSKVHTGKSVEQSGAEVQKGNAVEERKLQRLFRNPRATGLVKRCNDFGAGGVAVAVGELAPGLDINLDGMPKKYAGLNGIELAISESQERMAVVTAPGDADAFIRLAREENLDAVVIATVTAGGATDRETPERARPGEQPARMRLTWQGEVLADLSRDFLNSNGAPRSARATLSLPDGAAVVAAPVPDTGWSPDLILDRLERELASLHSGSRRGLQERFDGSIGAGSVLFPWGGREQGTPECGMAALLPSLDKESRTASLMTFGYDPDLMSQSPYEGAKGAVREALVKFACLGGNPWKARLSFQEYFERAEDPISWGKPAAALLGALEAQLMLGVPAIGGKDSMSGSYRDPGRGIDLRVPPSLAAFAAGIAPVGLIRSGALSGEPGNPVILLSLAADETGEWGVFRANMDILGSLNARGLVRSAYPVAHGGVAAALAVMAFGNMTGVEVEAAALGEVLPGSALLELGEDPGPEALGALMAELTAGESAGNAAPRWCIAARTLAEPVYRVRGRCLPPEAPGEESAEAPLAMLRRAYEYPLAEVYPQTAAGTTVAEPAAVSREGLLDTECPHRGSRAGARQKSPAPLVVIPVFPGTNCEWDMERAFRAAGARTRQVLFRNRTREDIGDSIRALSAAIGEAQIVALPGGFSAGDEPEGSGKFIANVFRTPAVADAVTGLLENRDGLILGICNGFQALIKLGLLPYGVYREAKPGMPTLSFNRLGRHVSRMVRTRVMSNRSPWLAREECGAIHVIPVSHGEGRVVIRREDAAALFASGQVPCCYAGPDGRPTLAEPDNPNGSDFAIEAMTSPDGRVLGKMAHSERRGTWVHINIPGNKHQRIFEAGVDYFR
jgi:phosphoribosylformylglycinamidine synthase